MIIGRGYYIVFTYILALNSTIKYQQTDLMLRSLKDTSNVAECITKWIQLQLLSQVLTNHTKTIYNFSNPKKQLEDADSTKLMSCLTQVYNGGLNVTIVE